MRLIDADALLKEVENEQKYLIARGQLSEEHILVHSLKRPVLDAPTVDAVEQKRGRWIPIVKGERGYSAGDFRCSVCGDPCKCYHLTNYCPNCGAEMRTKETDRN